MHEFHVHAHLVVAFVLVAGDEIDVGKGVALGHVETLETGGAQLQCVVLILRLAFGIGIGGDILHAVGISSRLPFLVKLEDVDVFIVPVVYPVTEHDGLAFAALLLDGDSDVVVGGKERHVGKEITGGIERQLVGVALIGLDAIVHFYLIDTGFSTTVVDTEGEQRLVAHTPEQFLVFQPFHARVFQHVGDGLHIYGVAVDGSVNDFLPRELLGNPTGAAEIGDVGHILRIVEFEILGCNTQSHQPEDGQRV